MKTIFLIILLTISIDSISQQVSYNDLVGTSWRSFDETQVSTITFTFIDSTHLMQESYAPRYQPKMGTVMKYSLDTKHDTTLLNVEWKGELLKCTSCEVKLSGDLLIIRSSANTKEDKAQSKTETSNNTWVLKKVATSGYRLDKQRILPSSPTLQHQRE